MGFIYGDCYVCLGSLLEVFVSYSSQTSSEQRLDLSELDVHHKNMYY